MPTKAKIEARAERLLSEHAVLREPVPVEDLARKLGARLSFQPFEREMSGMLYREHGRVVIGVNATHAPTRQRFSIAHEIGHLLLHQGRPMFIDRDGRLNRRDELSTLGTDREEIEANSFAAALLMPQSLLADATARLHRSNRPVSPEILAAKFAVSVRAMEYRLINLGILAPS